MKNSLFAAAAFLAAAVTVHAALAPADAERLRKAAAVLQDVRNSIPQDLWNHARCTIVLPDLKGVMSCRAGDAWSAPVFMQIAARAQEGELVLLVMNEEGVQKLLRNRVNLGADASVAAGPVGAAGSVGTAAAMTAEIVSYSRAKGLFAGVNLSGGVLRPEDEANRLAYGANASPRTILASREISAPPEAAPFLAALRAASVAASAVTAAAPAASTPPTPRTTTPPITDDDVRTQLTSMQATLERMLANAAPSPVGTTGGATPADGTLVVDRAALMQLRQQVEAALQALNRR